MIINTLSLGALVGTLKTIILYSTFHRKNYLKSMSSLEDVKSEWVKEVIFLGIIIFIFY